MPRRENRRRRPCWLRWIRLFPLLPSPTGKCPKTSAISKECPTAARPPNCAKLLRELLDHLAPDEEVLKTVKPEKDQRGPKMKQKAIFILKARGVGEIARKTAGDAVGAVEDSVGSLARSVYTRGSVSTHVVTTRNEVLTLKGYADAVIANLLQVHK